MDPLLARSIEVIRDCVRANGAVVAANSDRADYPRQVQDYRYVWPRDASYICVAAARAGIRHFQENFFNWLLNRAEDVRECGLLFQNYHVNGPKRWLGLQIDQNGSILWAIEDFYGGDYPQEIRTLVKLLADGIVSIWGNGSFTALTQDLWEERYAYPDLGQFHSYSLGACVKGLRCAARLNPSYGEAASSMEKALIKANLEGIHRTPGGLRDDTCDASLLGLVWPFEIYRPSDPLVSRLIADIEQSLVKGGGVHRYVCDYYDGHRRYGMNSRRGSGSWPILNFWLAIVLALRGEQKKSRHYAEHVLERVRDNLIPEQLFENDIQESVRPLGWSHAMYILYRSLAGTTGVP